MKGLTITRRIGSHPHAVDSLTSSKPGCPDIFELSNGNFAVIGRNKTRALKGRLPNDASCGPDESIVEVDRHVLVNARNDIPKS